MKILAFNLLFILSFFSIFHSVYYYRMKAKIYPELGQAVAPYIDADLMKRLGSFATVRKTSSFLNYPMKKSNPHKIRIGIFGDSYVYGDEVGPAGDYPTQLQALLGDQYEVLNFGMSWFSISQSFILWQEMHEKFDLDLVVFGPRSQFRYRNLTFNHTEDTHPHYLHSRFIIEADQSLKEIVPLGENHQERVLNYYGIFPSLQYWRYDERAPSLLRSYGHYFKTKLRNPFYYFEDTYTENRLINKVLLQTMAAESKDFLFATEFDYLEVEKLKGFLSSEDGVQILPLENHHLRGFPFRATNGHCTVFGNALFAKALANKILGKTELISTPHFQVNNSLVPVRFETLVQAPKLSELIVELNNQPIALFEIFPSFWKTQAPDRDLSLDQFEVLLGFACENLPLERTSYIGISKLQLVELMRILKREELPLLNFRETPNLIFLSMKDCFFSDKDHTISFASNIYHKILVEELKLLEIFEQNVVEDEYNLYRASGDWIKLRVDPDLNPNLLDTTQDSENTLSFRYLLKKI